MAINKVVYGNDTLIDLTSDTVTADKVLDGYTFHDASGTQRTGTGGGGITFPLDISDNTNNVTGVLNPVNGGTGNDSGYVRAGQKANTTIGNYATAEGYSNTASGNYSHAEGYNTTASGGDSHAEGYNTIASGLYAHAEGGGDALTGYTTASHNASHAEGYATTASGLYTHTEGERTSASARCAHAEGNGSTASGAYSHAEGQGTIAKGMFSHAQGKYNIQDNNDTYAHIVGNGTSSARSNAHTVDWEGNAWFAGDVEDGNGNTITKNSNDLRYYEQKGYFSKNIWTGRSWFSGSGVLLSDYLLDYFDAYDGDVTISFGTISGSADITFDFLYNQGGAYAHSSVTINTSVGYGTVTLLNQSPWKVTITSSANVDIYNLQMEKGNTVSPYAHYVPTIPPIVNDRYLHTNATTGALEWVQGGGGGGSSATVLGGTLEAGDTELTFTSNAITATAMIDIYAVDSADIGYINREVSGTTLTITFPPQETDVNIRVRIEETGE